MKSKEVEVKINVEFDKFLKTANEAIIAAEKVQLLLKQISEQKIVVNIESRTVKPKRWYQFWK